MEKLRRFNIYTLNLLFFLDQIMPIILLGVEAIRIRQSLKTHEDPFENEKAKVITRMDSTI